MNRMKSGRLLILLVLVGSLLGCATYAISPEMRQKARQDLPFSTVLRNPEAYEGEMVIWGGVIIETINERDTTSMEVLQIPLDAYGVPQAEEYTQGRFIAKVPGYVDREIYREGRRMTMAGEIIGHEVRPMGETDYIYPIISAREIRLWREGPYYGGPAPYDPWYGPGVAYPYLMPQFHFFFHN